MSPADVLKRAQKRARVEALELAFAQQLRAHRIPFETQAQLAAPREFRWDFVVLGPRVAIEIHGGQWTNGAHNRGAGLERDCEKLALASINGWTQLSITGDQVRSGLGIEWVRQLLQLKGWVTC